MITKVVKQKTQVSEGTCTSIIFCEASSAIFSCRALDIHEKMNGIDFLTPIRHTTEMPLSKIVDEIAATLNADMIKFLKKIEQDKNISFDESYALWEKVSQDKKKKKNKMNCYLLFQRETRPSVVTSHPSFSFGDISRELGRRWRSLPGEAKDVYRKRAQIMNKYHSHDIWLHYKDYPIDKLYHIAHNWFEDEPSVSLANDASKEEILELFILHSDVKPSTPKNEASPNFMDMYSKYSHKSYKDILKEIKKEFPSFSDGPYTNKDDLIAFLIEQKTRVEDVPLEVHPYYYTLVKKSLEALKELCREISPDYDKEIDENDRRKLIELLVRNFDKAPLEEK